MINFVITSGAEIPSWYVTPANASPYLLPPCILSMYNFSEHKRVGDQWFSNPFYTGHNGYKLKLKVCANGAGKLIGMHVSVHVHLMKGENDERLTWPFKCDITIQLLNWREDKGHVEKTVSFNDRTDINACRRVMEEDTASYGFGYGQFISHSDLNHSITNNTVYINNDILCFVVSKVIVYSK